MNIHNNLSLVNFSSVASQSFSAVLVFNFKTSLKVSFSFDKRIPYSRPTLLSAYLRAQLKLCQEEVY